MREDRERIGGGNPRDWASWPPPEGCQSTRRHHTTSPSRAWMAPPQGELRDRMGEFQALTRVLRTRHKPAGGAPPSTTAPPAAATPKTTKLGGNDVYVVAKEMMDGVHGCSQKLQRLSARTSPVPLPPGGEATLIPLWVT